MQIITLLGEDYKNNYLENEDTNTVKNIEEKI